MPDDIFKSNDDHRRLSMKIKKDIFYEMSVSPASAKGVLMYTVYLSLAIACGIIAFALLLISGMKVVYFMLSGVIFVLLSVFFYMSSQKARIEYDYTFTNGILDIAKITNDKNRKKLVSVNVANELLEMKPITSESFQRFFNDKSVKKVNLFLNKGTHLYYMHIMHKGNKIIIVFEPDGQLVEYMKLFNPDNIFC